MVHLGIFLVTFFPLWNPRLSSNLFSLNFCSLLTLLFIFSLFPFLLDMTHIYFSTISNCSLSFLHYIFFFSFIFLLCWIHIYYFTKSHILHTFPSTLFIPIFGFSIIKPPFNLWFFHELKYIIPEVGSSPRWGYFHVIHSQLRLLD